MRSYWALSALVLACCTTAAMAQPIMSWKTLPVYEHPKAAATQPTVRVATLVRTLSDASPATRETAQQALLKMGPDIKPQLQWALNAEEEPVAAKDREKPAVQKFIARGFGMDRYPPSYAMPRPAYHALTLLIDRLGDRRQSSLITLHYTNAPLTDVLRDFGKQLNANISMGVQSGSSVPTMQMLDWVSTTRITINVDHASYWKALQTIMQTLPVPPAERDAQQFMQVGFDKVYLGSTLNNRILGLADSNPTVSGPLLIAPIMTGTTLTLRALAEPSLTTLNGNAMVRIDTLTDDLGHSLLTGDKRIFLPVGENYRDYIPSDGYRLWKVPIELAALAPSRSVGTIKGEFGIGTTPATQPIAIPLIPPYDATPDAIFVAEDCEILGGSNPDGSPYHRDKEVCREERTYDTRRGRSDIEEQTLVLKNVNATPVTFVVSKWLFGGRVDSTPQPDQVREDAAIFRVHADPGQVVHLHIGVRYNRNARAAVRLRSVAPEAEGRNGVTFDGWTLTVKSVEHDGALYKVSGALSRPANSPAGEQGIYIYLSLLDEGRWSIVNAMELSEQRQEGDRVIENWTVTTREPGRIPATLLWNTPEATHWLNEPFELHNITAP